MACLPVQPPEGKRIWSLSRPTVAFVPSHRRLFFKTLLREKTRALSKILAGIQVSLKDA